MPHPRLRFHHLCGRPFETAEEFGYRIYSEARRRAWEWAKLKVILGDGTVWPVTDPQPGIWNLAHQHFPGAIQIVDLYHPATFLHPNDPAAKKRWMVPMKELLDQGEIQPLVALVARLREIAAEQAASHPGLQEEILKEAEYFDTNASRRNYPRFRAMGLFVGSGIIGAGCSPSSERA